MAAGRGTPRRSGARGCFRLRQLDARVGRETADRKKRVAKSNFRVIEGGRSKDDDDAG
ncbi:MAG: hypothetical protein R3B89_25935 [Polyangiaceae bacterium]